MAFPPDFNVVATLLEEVIAVTEALLVARAMGAAVCPMDTVRRLSLGILAASFLGRLLLLLLLVW